MSKYLVLAAALLVLAVACQKKEETAAPAAESTAAPAETAPAADMGGEEGMPADEHADESAEDHAAHE